MQRRHGEYARIMTGVHSRFRPILMSSGLHLLSEAIGSFEPRLAPSDSGRWDRPIARSTMAPRSRKTAHETRFDRVPVQQKPEVGPARLAGVTWSEGSWKTERKQMNSHRALRGDVRGKGMHLNERGFNMACEHSRERIPNQDHRHAHSHSQGQRCSPKQYGASGIHSETPCRFHNYFMKLIQPCL